MTKSTSNWCCASFLLLLLFSEIDSQYYDEYVGEPVPISVFSPGWLDNEKLPEVAFRAILNQEVRDLVKSQPLLVNAGDEKRTLACSFSLANATALLRAVQCPSANREPNATLQMVEFLLQNGADVNLHDLDNNLTALMMASWYGDLEIVQMLLDKGANADFRSKNNWTALMAAVAHSPPVGQEERARNLVKIVLDKTNLVEQATANGHTALNFALSNAHYNNSAIFKMLIDRNPATVNFRDRNGWSPIMWLAATLPFLDRNKKDSFELAGMLMQAGANLTLKDNGKGWTVLNWAIDSNGDADLIRLFLDNSEQLLNARDDDGMTALMQAIRVDDLYENGTGGIVDLLLDRRADLNVKDSQGQTALHYAAKFNFLRINNTVKLIENGAYMEAKTATSWTPLIVASSGKGNPLVARYLLEKGAEKSNCVQFLKWCREFLLKNGLENITLPTTTVFRNRIVTTTLKMLSHDSTAIVDTVEGETNCGTQISNLILLILVLFLIN